MPHGLGLAERTRVVPPKPESRAALPDLKLPPPRRSALGENPLSAIGFALQSAAAGIEGRPPPAAPERPREADELALIDRRLKLLGNAIDSVDQRPELARQVGAVMEEALPGATGLLVAMSQDRGLTEAGKKATEAMFRDPKVARAINEQAKDLPEAFSLGKAYADVLSALPDLRYETIIQGERQILIALDRSGNEVFRKNKGPAPKKDLKFETIEENGRLMQIGTNPTSGKIESRQDLGPAPTGDLDFRFMKTKEGTFLVAHDKKDGQEIFRKQAEPVGKAITQAQQADNIEIDTARQRALSIPVPPGSTLRDEINRRTQRTSDTGRDNPDFDETLSRALRKATQRKIGDDPGFHDFLDRLDVRTPLPDAPPPPPEEPGIIDRVLGFFSGGDEQPRQGASDDQVLSQARDAIKRGADPEAVRQRLESMGIDPGRL